MQRIKYLHMSVELHTYTYIHTYVCMQRIKYLSVEVHTYECACACVSVFVLHWCLQGNATLHLYPHFNELQHIKGEVV